MRLRRKLRQHLSCAVKRDAEYAHLAFASSCQPYILTLFILSHVISYYLVFLELSIYFFMSFCTKQQILHPPRSTPTIKYHRILPEHTRDISENRYSAISTQNIMSSTETQNKLCLIILRKTLSALYVNTTSIPSKNATKKIANSFSIPSMAYLNNFKKKLSPFLSFFCTSE